MTPDGPKPKIEVGEGIFTNINISDLKRRQKDATIREVPDDLLDSESVLDEKFIPVSVSDLIYLIALQINEANDQNKFIKFARHLCYHIHVALYDDFLIAQKSYQSQVSV